MSSNCVPRGSGNLKWWLAASLLLLVVSFALPSVVVPSGGLDSDDVPNPVSGWVCFVFAFQLARGGNILGILFLIPTLWIPVSLLLAGGGRIRTCIALVVTAVCTLIQLGACAWVFHLGAAVYFGFLAWGAATLTQCVGFFLHLEEREIPEPCPESAGGCVGEGPGSLAQGES